MKHKLGTIVLVAGLLIIGAGSVVYFMQGGAKDSSSQSVNTADAVKTNEVSIEDFAYAPAVIQVKKGTKVTWTNKDSVKHSVTTQEGAEKPFDSGLFGEGETYEYTFDTVGTYQYYCTPHPYMKATVVVTE